MAGAYCDWGGQSAGQRRLLRKEKQQGDDACCCCCECEPGVTAAGAPPHRQAHGKNYEELPFQSTTAAESVEAAMAPEG
uniref:Uncharacterized protein n=1 Tax=Oryza sativa subsp. japonica TaxID=39947 RepID=Q6K5S0_ORYSJ|nr:hypothetical protein [Oryza sativa Japonica Group]